MMNVFPVKEYHFFVLLLPFKFYHGVEHVANTVLALGPGNQLMNDDLYNDFLGVASHELFHSWNVKTLRPADFHTYQYNKENYMFF
jgi:predicted metalloprotease with PDZ domain